VKKNSQVVDKLEEGDGISLRLHIACNSGHAHPTVVH